MSYAIDISNLSMEFKSGGKSVKALDCLSLQVKAGTVFGFLGPNGAGKTTTMHILLGFIEQTSGEAKIFETDTREHIARQRIGYLQEHPDTYRFLTGRELLYFTGKFFNMTASVIKQRSNELLKKVMLEDGADRKIATYSRGMMQRIALAQALINDPDLVILDEPTSGLDPFGRMEVRNIIQDLKSRGKTIFFSSHELSEVELVCDNVAIISRGKIVAQGETGKIIPKGENLEKYFMKVAK